MREMKTELAVRKAIARQLDDLICAASRNVERLEGSEMKENQIRNVLNVAAASESVEEVTNFIRYQIGRDAKKNTWAHKKGGEQDGFGALIIADIEKGAVKTAVGKVREAAPEADPAQVRSRLIALYLGYLNRCFIYADKTKSWQHLCSKLEEREEDAAHE